MNVKRRNRKNMNSQVVGIDIDEEKSTVTYISPEGKVKENFEFDMSTDGYIEFTSRIPRETRIAFELDSAPDILGELII